MLCSALSRLSPLRTSSPRCPLCLHLPTLSEIPASSFCSNSLSLSLSAMASGSAGEREKQRLRELEKDLDQVDVSPGKTPAKESDYREKAPDIGHASSEGKPEKPIISPGRSFEKWSDSPKRTPVNETVSHDKEPETVHALPEKEHEKQIALEEKASGKEDVSAEEEPEKERGMSEIKPTSSDSALTMDAKKLNLLPAMKYLLKKLDLEHVDLNKFPQMVEQQIYYQTERSEKPLDSPAEASNEKNAQSAEIVSSSSVRGLPMLKESHSVGANLERYDQIGEDKGVKKTDEPEKPLIFRTEVDQEKLVYTLKQLPHIEANVGNLDENQMTGATESATLVEEAWERLQKSYVYFRGKPVGTLAAIDPSAEPLNYNQVFVRDFVPSGLACLMKNPPEPEIVKNFLLQTLHLQGCQKKIDNFTLGEGVMPASFKVLYDPKTQKESLVADFGGSAIGRVAPIDSVFWWIILLRSYTKCTGDNSFSELPQVQGGMKSILKLCLCDGFNNFPTLLCADGCCMVDRSMGINGYPIEIQSLFYFALRCARQMLKPEHGGKEFFKLIDARITALSFHVQTYYWLDITQLNNIYRYKTEEYSHTAVNKFNIIPDSIPEWLFDFMPLRGGFFMGNVSPGRMDFRWFLAGNCIAILSSLATSEQATAIMDLIEERWEQLIGEMPLKIVYPALEGHYWELVTGCDPKNTPWSYHNGGSWPVLLWLLTAACIKTGRPEIAKRAIELVEQRLSKDGWPEYYDGKTGRYIGKQARKFQTWSIAGYLVAKMMIENESTLLVISHEEEKKSNKPRHTRSSSCFF